MQDVADAAGVSVGTASNVLNHLAKVSPATAERVREAISHLGFVRNDAARSLVSGSTNSVGMVLADIENSLFIDMAHGAQNAARAIGQNLLLVASPSGQPLSRPSAPLRRGSETSPTDP